MNEEQLIATLQACYFGDKGAFNKILKEYKQLQTEKEQLNSLVNSCQQEIRNLKIQISAREEVANKLQSTLEEIRKVINQPFPSYASCIKAIDEIEYIIDKEGDVK